MDASLDCQSQVLAVGWNATTEADRYVAVISDGSTQMSYNTTAPSLRINALECGQDYTLTVTSVHDACVSHPSQMPVWKGEMSLSWTIECVFSLSDRHTHTYNITIVIIKQS